MDRIWDLLGVFICSGPEHFAGLEALQREDAMIAINEHEASVLPLWLLGKLNDSGDIPLVLLEELVKRCWHLLFIRWKLLGDLAPFVVRIWLLEDTKEGFHRIKTFGSDAFKHTGAPLNDSLAHSSIGEEFINDQIVQGNAM